MCERPSSKTPTDDGLSGTPPQGSSSGVKIVVRVRRVHTPRIFESKRIFRFSQVRPRKQPGGEHVQRDIRTDSYLWRNPRDSDVVILRRRQFFTTSTAHDAVHYGVARQRET